jgi:hypothetical protein
MTNGGNADRFSTVGQLIDDPIRADSQGVQTAEFSAQRIAGEGVAFEQSQCILNRIDQRPAQLEQVASSSPGKDEARQGSTGGWPAFGQLAAKLGEGDRLSPLDLGKTRLQCG